MIRQKPDEKNQEKQGLKILTPNQMLKLDEKQEIIQKNLKMEQDNYCIPSIVQKN